MSQLPVGNFSRNPQAQSILLSKLSPIRSMVDRAINQTKEKVTSLANNIATESQLGFEQLQGLDTTIFYPDELSRSPEYQAYMVIHIYEPVTTTFESASTNLSTALGNFAIQSAAAAVGKEVGGLPGALIGAGLGGILKEADFSPIDYGDNATIFRDRISPTRQLMSVKSQFSKITTSVGLPMPKTLKTNYGFEYEDVDFSNATTISVVAQAVKNAGLDDSQKNFLAGKANSLSRGITDSLMNIIPGGELNLDAFENTRAGLVKSPLSENIFKQVNRRSFDFSWTMIPKNRKEVNSILSIINILKSYSHPAIIDDDPYYLEVPGEFLIQFLIKKQENLLLPKIGRLCMKEISVDYGSENGMSFFRMENDSNIGGVVGNIGGALPTKITLTIKLEELERLTESSIRQGY
jgi:hypothetical protein